MAHGDLKIENLVFRQVENRESKHCEEDSSDEDMQSQRGKQSPATVDANRFVTASNKNSNKREDREENEWLSKEAKIFNLKQIIDNWTPKNTAV